MNKIFLLLALLVPSCSTYAGDPPPLTINLPGRIYEIPDGDTVNVEITFRVSLRLRDCWTPEVRTGNLQQKKFGLAARDNLVKHALGKQAIIVIPFDIQKLQKHTGRIDDVFTFGRPISEVYINGKRLADIQYEAGVSGRTKEEQRKLFPLTQKTNGIETDVDP